MRPVSFPPNALRKLLLRNKIVTLPELKDTLGTQVAQTVFRKLKPMDYITSYSHAGRYYALREAARFDTEGLWPHKAVWFSSHGTLLATASDFVRRSPNGYFASELARRLHVDVHDTLLQLVNQQQLTRQLVAGTYLYTAVDAALSRRQQSARRELPVIAGVSDLGHLEMSTAELNAAIVLFYSMLDEKQRRLYAGLESLKLGHGGDCLLADLLGVDPHTVARGRRELMTGQFDAERIRRSGGGRPAMEKKPLK